MTTFKIKPADPNIPVRDPATRKPLHAKGENKPRSSYWLRRLSDGSVVDITKKTSGGSNK